MLIGGVGFDLIQFGGVSGGVSVFTCYYDFISIKYLSLWFFVFKLTYAQLTNILPSALCTGYAQVMHRGLFRLVYSSQVLTKV